ncbi:MAG TPA: alpha/beta hydrolase-fold protein [Agriterribacter sp.]|nr:alpha/beta hydrolase-fold protein [Agriterribacter sp.]
MLTKNKSVLPVLSHRISSGCLQREVRVDFFMPHSFDGKKKISLLLINDGQDMKELGLANMLSALYEQNAIEPIFCVGIHCGADRKNEYGTALVLDYKGRGAKASLYTQFILHELLPFIHRQTGIRSFKDKSFAGFSLGGLSALDIVWNHPEEFLKAGVFSGSLWWRTRALDEGYVEETDRIMHAQVRKGGYYPWLKFFFETGTLDETEDRNNNGIIDAIDDTMDLIKELQLKGYHPHHDIAYLELKDGTHNVATWAKAMPYFLRWGWELSGGNEDIVVSANTR